MIMVITGRYSTTHWALSFLNHFPYLCCYSGTLIIIVIWLILTIEDPNFKLIRPRPSAPLRAPPRLSESAAHKQVQNKFFLYVLLCDSQYRHFLNAAAPWSALYGAGGGRLVWHYHAICVRVREPAQPCLDSLLCHLFIKLLWWLCFKIKLSYM